MARCFSALVLFYCFISASGAGVLLSNPVTLYNALKAVANRAIVAKPDLFTNCDKDTKWQSVLDSARKTYHSDSRKLIRHLSQSLVDKYSSDAMFIAVYTESPKNVSVSIQADGNMAEWGTVFSNLAKYSFGCTTRSGLNETGIYIVRRPSKDDLSRVSTQKLVAFAKMVGNQQDFKDLLKFNSLDACSNDKDWKTLAKGYLTSRSGNSTQNKAKEVDSLKKLVVNASDHFSSNILVYAHTIKMDPQPKNIMVSFAVEAGAKQADWLRIAQQVTEGCQILHSSTPFSATGMGYMKMRA